MNTIILKALPFWITAFMVFAAVFVTMLLVGIRFSRVKNSPDRQMKGTVLVYVAFVLFLSFFTRFLGYNYPFNTFWDENYHVASAQKYISRVFFMEPHPPLGKMLIALGEVIVHPNDHVDTTSFVSTDYIRDFPPGYSFLGVRFMPVLMSTLSCVLFFLLIFLLTRNPHYSFLFSFLYIFENSMILHTRSAMLEGPQFFFILLALVYFARLLRGVQQVKPREYLFLGLLTGLAVSVKVNALILLFQFVILAWKDHRDELLTLGLSFLRIKKPSELAPYGMIAGRIAVKAAGAILGIAAVFCLTYYLHNALGNTVVSGRTYRASPDTVRILGENGMASPFNFPVLFRDHIAFISHYEKGVPRWDPTKADENGSPAFTWPFGYKSINYRWEKSLGRVAYFYFQGNPVIWYAGLLAVFLAVALILSKTVFGVTVSDRGRFRAVVLFTVMYLGYLLVMTQIQRVMYLNHYLLPLMFAMVLFALVFQDVFERLMAGNDRLLYYAVTLFALEVFVVYLFFSPLTYGILLSAPEFAKRVWMQLWDLRAIYY